MLVTLRKIFAVAALGGLAVFSSPVFADTDWDGMILRAEKAAKNGNHQVAIDIYSEVVSQPFVRKSDTWLVWLYFHRAKSHLALERYQRAIDDLRKAIEIDDQVPAAFLHYGEALFHLRKFDQAIRKYDQALKLKPDYFLALTLRGGAFLAMEKFDHAIASFRDSLEIEPNYWTTRFGLASVYKLQGKFEDALKLLNELIGEWPEQALLYVLRGQLRTDMGQEREGLRDFEIACERGYRPAKEHSMDEETWNKICPQEDRG